MLERIRDASGLPLVAHGLGLSPGTAEPDDSPRLKAWLEQIERDQGRFDFAWYTEHLGWCESVGRELLLPLPLPPTDEAVDTVVRRLSMLKPIVPFVGFENQTSFIPLDDLRTEARFWNRICAKGDLWLLLDLHNAWTHCRNFGVSTDEYLAELDFCASSRFICRAAARATRIGCRASGPIVSTRMTVRFRKASGRCLRKCGPSAPTCAAWSSNDWMARSSRAMSPRWRRKFNGRSGSSGNNKSEAARSRSFGEGTGGER